MMNWSCEERLRLIGAIATKSYNSPVGETHQLLMERIMFLCNASEEFLEINKSQYQDEIRLLESEADDEN